MYIRLSSHPVSKEVLWICLGCLHQASANMNLQAYQMSVFTSIHNNPEIYRQRSTLISAAANMAVDARTMPVLFTTQTL
jgi:hypothetical protein